MTFLMQLQSYFTPGAKLWNHKCWHFYFLQYNFARYFYHILFTLKKQVSRKWKLVQMKDYIYAGHFFLIYIQYYFFEDFNSQFYNSRYKDGKIGIQKLVYANFKLLPADLMEFHCSNYDGKFELVLGEAKMLAVDGKREIEKSLN